MIVVDHPFGILVAPQGPPTRQIEELAVVSVTELAPARHVVDFGQNSNGWIRLTDLGPEGTELRIAYGEWLDADGDVTQEHIAHAAFAVPREVPLRFQTDVVISAGDGSVFEPRHSTKGCQYVRIEGHPGPLDPAAVTSVVVHSDLAPIGALNAPTSASTGSTAPRSGASGATRARSPRTAPPVSGPGGWATGSSTWPLPPSCTTWPTGPPAGSPTSPPISSRVAPSPTSSPTPARRTAVEGRPRRLGLG